MTDDLNDELVERCARAVCLTKAFDCVHRGSGSTITTGECGSCDEIARAILREAHYAELVAALEAIAAPIIAATETTFDLTRIVMDQQACARAALALANAKPRKDSSPTDSV